MVESRIYPSKHEILVWELEEVVRILANANFDQSVADTGNWAAHEACKMIEAAIAKSMEETDV